MHVAGPYAAQLITHQRREVEVYSRPPHLNPRPQRRAPLISCTGFVFANPQPSPDDFNTFDPQDVYADSAVVAAPVVEAIPAPWKNPPVMALADVLGSAAVQQIQNAGQIVFHSVGDTGGVKEPSHRFAVADAMTDDLTGKDYSSG